MKMALKGVFKVPTTPATQFKVGKVMSEFKRGTLKSGGKRKVVNRKQAIAIALSEARQLKGMK